MSAMTEHDRLRLERKGAVAVFDAIAGLRTPPRTIAVDLVLGMAEYAAREIVEDYDRRLAAPEPRVLPFELASGE